MRRARPGWRSPGRGLSPRLGRSAGDPSPSPPLLSGHTAAPRRHSGTHPKGSLRSPPHHPAPSQPLPRFARAGAKTTQITGGTQLEAQKPPARLWVSGLWGSCPSDGLGRFKGARCSLPGWPAPWSRRAWGREKRLTRPGRSPRAPVRLRARPVVLAPAASIAPFLPEGRPD